MLYLISPKGKCTKQGLKCKRNTLTKIEDIVHYFDTVARTNETQHLATSEILITKHWEWETFKLDYALKTVV